MENKVLLDLYVSLLYLKQSIGEVEKLLKGDLDGEVEKLLKGDLEKMQKESASSEPADELF